MKAAFLALCVVCAVLLNVLIFTIQTGKIPFRDAVEPVAVEAVASNIVVEGSVAPLSEVDRRSFDEIVKAFQTERAVLDARRAELDLREESIKLKEAVKVEIEALQNEFEKRIFEVKAEQQLNLRRLADMYAKMDPTLASNLLREGDRKHAAAVLGMMADRAVAAIMDATVQSGGTNLAAAAEWVETIRTLTVEKQPEATE